MRTARFSDEEILEACREISGKGIDPTYKSLRAAGFPCSGDRLLNIRDTAVADGRLTLPANSKVRGHVAQALLAKRAHVPATPNTGDVTISEIIQEYRAVERRLFPWRRKRKIQVGPSIQWAFFFSDRRIARWKHTVRGGVKWIKPPKASKPSGRQAQFDSVAG